MTKIGVFYDGGWWAHVSDYYGYQHRRRARIAFEGLHDAIRWHVHSQTGVPVEDCAVVETHHVRARPVTPSTVFDRVLDQAGITRHDVELRSGTEKGADVQLALETWDRAVTAHLDVVVLISGDADFVPLVTRLTSRGVRVVVPTIDVEFPSAGQVRVLRTADQLADHATDAPTLDQLLTTATAPDYPLRHPFVPTTGGGADRAATAPPSAPGSPGRRRGTITRWHADEPYGFITDDHGRSWFASGDSLPTETTAPPVGTQVTFAGSPTPKPGKRYPEAYTIRPAQAHETPTPPRNTLG